MTSAKNVFDLTMALIDELNDVGQADTGDTKEYKDRTLQILNILQGELYMYSDTYKLPVDGKRSIAAPIVNFTDPIVDLDDYICRSVLPHGLAAYLLMDENPGIASTCLQRYEELRSRLMGGLQVGSEDIIDLYGGFAHCEYGYWR